MIRTPDWIDSRLGNYYLYFADHKGSTFGSHTQMFCWDPGGFIRPAVCSSNSRVF
jgi:hypothetical protein